MAACAAAAQIISYEIPAAIAIMTVIIPVGSLSMVDIVNAQKGGIQNWFLFRNPFTFLAFFVYFIASLAEVNRTPFDIPEAESELVAGFHTEYSGMRFAFFFLAEYANMLLVTCVATTLFLGGWTPGSARGFPAYSRTDHVFPEGFRASSLSRCGCVGPFRACASISSCI